MLALGTAAPEASVTVPCTAVVDWPKREAVNSKGIAGQKRFARQARKVRERITERMTMTAPLCARDVKSPNTRGRFLVDSEAGELVSMREQKNGRRTIFLQIGWPRGYRGLPYV